MKAARIISILLVFLMAAALCACGSSSSKTTAYSADEYAPAEANGLYGGFAGAAVNMAAVESEEYYDASAEQMEADGQPADYQDKIIYSADVTVEATEFDSSLTKLNELINQYGGYVEASSTSGANLSSIQQGKKTTRSADYTIRIPAESFDAIMNNFSQLGNIPYSHVYTDNITSRYYDTAARLKTYEAQEERILELLDKAETVSDVIEIENELTEIRYRIESLQTSLTGWDRQVSYSTIYLTLREVSEYTPQDSPGYGGRLLESLKDGFDRLGDFIIDFVGALPILIVIGVIAFALVKLIKKLRMNAPKREERKANRKAKSKDPKCNGDT